MHRTWYLVRDARLMIEDMDIGTSHDVAMVQLCNDLFILDNLSRDGKRYVKWDLDYDHEVWGFGFVARAILGTANDNGVNYNDTAFIKDGTISNKELKFLRVLYEDLVILENSLSEENGLNVRSNITIKEYRDAMDIFFKKWGYKNANGYIDGEVSPYMYLIE